jgi:hypothetical protein
MRKSLLALGLTIAVSAPAYAHHSFAMFDNTKTVTWSGTVAEFDWTNPHTHIIVIIPPTEKVTSLVGKWDIEGASPNIMSRQGWTKSSFKVGDKITIVGHPLRDGAHGGSLYYAIDKDGKRLYHDINRGGGPGGGSEAPPAG